MAIRIDGKKTAADVTEKVTQATDALIKSAGITPGLAVIIVGEDPASQVYVANKAKTATACGFHSVRHALPADTPESDVLSLVHTLNDDPAIHGILVQLPLPKQMDDDKIIQSVAPEKDVDGFHFINAGKVSTGALDDAFVPCTPAGSMLLLSQVLDGDLSGKTAVVVGRSNIVGKPMFNLLLGANATVTVAHSRSPDLAHICRNADVLVAAVGRPEMIKGDWIKPGAIVIDVGINRIDAPEKGEGKTRLVGDVAYDEAAAHASAITPVPGGVGPMTIAMLMVNTLRSAYRTAGVALDAF